MLNLVSLTTRYFTEYSRFVIQGGGFEHPMNRKETLPPIKMRQIMALKTYAERSPWQEPQILIALLLNFS